MTTRLSWKPINFDRWTNLAFMMTKLGVASTANLASAILGMRVSWDRMAEDLNQLFVPSGPPGTHAAHHFHGPSDPSVRERVLASVVTDYESALVYMDVALHLCVENLRTVSDQPYKDWGDLVKAAERETPGLATNARDAILYLQRTPLYVRNDAIVHPQALLPLTGFDNVGNLLLRRVSVATPSDTQVLQLNDLLHEILPWVKDDAKVGISISPAMALNWLGAVSFKVDDWRLLNELRQAFGFLLPGAYEIAPQVDSMVDHFITALPDTEFAQVVFAAGPTSISTPSAEEPVAGPRQSDRMSFEALLEAGIMAAKSGQRERALTLFRQCLDVDPEDAEARFLVGQELIGADQLEDGLRFIYEAQAIGYEEDLIRRKLLLGHFNLGARHFTAREYDQAVHHYRRVRELDPTDLEAHRCLMEALAYAGRLNEAFRHAALLLREWPAVAEVQFGAAIVYFRAGDSKEALSHIQEALKLRPDWEKAVRFRNFVRSQTVPSAKSDEA
jgi:tetratricopeptide (TPR) repeat protein